MSEFTLRRTQANLRRMAEWYAKQEPVNYFPQSISHLDAYIFVTLHSRMSGCSGAYYATLNL